MIPQVGRDSVEPRLAGGYAPGSTESRPGEIELRVDVSRQRLALVRAGAVVKEYAVSTAERGVGSEPGSLRTPAGAHRVAFKFGEALPEGAVLKSREWTGAVWAPDAESQPDEDLVLTRVFWLEGLEPGNATSFSRYIYLHGTNQPARLGTPASHGCVRLSNADVIELYEGVPVGTPVWIEETAAE
jgi:lipoprotein-anchoring transpeptidase ErfK/SrfK